MTDQVFRNGRPLNPDDFESIDESGRAEAMRRHHAERAAEFHESRGGRQSNPTQWIGTPRLGKYGRKLRP